VLRWLWLLCACARFTVQGDAGKGADTSAALDQGLVGWWKLDETSGTMAADSSPSGATGTLMGGPVWQPVAKIGGGLQFTANNQRVDLGSPPAITSLAAISATAWLFIPTVHVTANTQCIFDKAAGASGWFFATSFFAAGDLYFRHATSTGAMSRASGPVLVPATWQHVAVTWDGGVTSNAIRFFVDGVETAYGQATDRTGAAGPDDTIPLGINCEGTTSALFATYDDVRLYNRVLTPFEIGVLAAQ
jgi:hypothetical protein